MNDNDFFTGDFEQLIKEKADQFRMYPSKRVWHSIYNNLHPSRRWPSLIMSLLLISSLSVIGYLNTSDNESAVKGKSGFKAISGLQKTAADIEQANNNIPVANNEMVQPSPGKSDLFDYLSNDNTYFKGYTIVRSNRPENFYTSQGANLLASGNETNTKTPDKPGSDPVLAMDFYIKSNQLFADVASKNRQSAASVDGIKYSIDNQVEAEVTGNRDNTLSAKVNLPGKIAKPSNNVEQKQNQDKIKESDGVNIPEKVEQSATNPKSWVENYALQNKPSNNHVKDRLSYQVYATPAVNYRRLRSDAKGSVAPFATADINKAISQKPGFGFEAGGNLTYAAAKNLQLKAGLQFNYTNYNIDADKIGHPIITTILLNDPNTGYSYSAARTSTISNVYNSYASQPVTLHNRTYQIALPVGFAYKLSSKNNVDWFAGATIQPTYVFGGNAHLISSDLKSYVSDPSTIRSWNLNLGFETFMNFKMGNYGLQVGPQVRYQVYSTYNKSVALIEKPYAVGLKLGLTKGF